MSAILDMAVCVSAAVLIAGLYLGAEHLAERGCRESAKVLAVQPPITDPGELQCASLGAIVSVEKLDDNKAAIICHCPPPKP